MSDAATGRPANPVWAWLRSDPRRFDVLVAVLVPTIGLVLISAAPDEWDVGWPEVAAGIGAFVLLLFRRWAPLPLLGIALVWSAIHVAVVGRPTPMIFAALVLMATFCVRIGRWPAIALGASIAICIYVMGLVTNDAEAGDARAVIGIAWTAVAVGVADAVRSWRSYREAAESELRSVVAVADADARRRVSEERLTIARELHDLLAHHLSVMNVQTGAALHLLRTDADGAEAALVAARDAGRSINDELGDVLRVLRRDDALPGAPTDSLPTSDELDALVDDVRGAGLDVAWHRSGAARPLTPAASLAVHRIVQESLTNAAKHGSGGARLETEWDDGGVSIRVENPVGDGSSGGTGHGLTGMRERAELNGGRFDTRSVDGRFVVEVWLPTAAERDAVR